MNDSVMLDIAAEATKFSEEYVVEHKGSNLLLCDYGCGRFGKFLQVNGLRTCAKDSRSCPSKNFPVKSKPYISARKFRCTFCDLEARYMVRTQYRWIRCCSSSYIDCSAYSHGRGIRKEKRLSIAYGPIIDLNDLITTSHKMKDIMSEKWADPDYAKKMGKALSIRPNKPEIYLLGLLEETFPGDYKYVGDFSFIVNGKSPDFICHNKNKIIELFGDYWHSKEVTGMNPVDHERERREIFKDYDVLIIWENELKGIEELNTKLIEFHRSD